MGGVWGDRSQSRSGKRDSVRGWGTFGEVLHNLVPVMSVGGQTLSLEHKSSLRKIPFPGCTIETLRRLHAACVTLGGHKQPSSPKEIEAMIDAIDEFVFNCNSTNVSNTYSGSSNASKRQLQQQGPTPLQDLQVLYTMLEFFSSQVQQSSSDSVVSQSSQFADLSVLCTVFMFLFMEPSGGSESKKSG